MTNPLGTITTYFNGSFAGINSMQVLSDGSLVVAGYAGAGQNFNFALAKYHSDASLDATFGNSGKVINGIGNDARINSLQVLSDGSILAAGYGTNSNSNGNTDFALAKYHSDGSLDTAFGSGGIVTTDFSGSNYVNDEINSLQVLSDGSILAAGTTNGDFALAKYHRDGSLDTAFGSNGIVTTANAYALQVLSDGSLVIAGYAQGDVAVAKYHSDGSLDTAFGTNGIVRTDFYGKTDYAYALQVLGDGSLVVAGFAENGGSNQFALVKYHSNGSLDTTFGTNGKVTTVIGYVDGIKSLQVLSDGSLVVAGNT